VSPLQWTVAVIGGIVLIYIVVRIASAAIYRSKMDYLRSLKNEQRP
jgi:hypothetical protein